MRKLGTIRMRTWLAAGALAAVAVAAALLGRPPRGASGVHVTGVRIEERGDGAVLAWSGDNDAGTGCRHAVRADGPGRRPLARGAFTAVTRLARPDAIAWLRVECDDGSSRTIPWDVSEVRWPEADRAPTTRGGRVEVARFRARVAAVESLVGGLVRGWIRRELDDGANVHPGSVRKLEVHEVLVEFDDDRVSMTVRAEAEADFVRTTCDHLDILGHVAWAGDGLAPDTTDVELALREDAIRVEGGGLLDRVRNFLLSPINQGLCRLTGGGWDSLEDAEREVERELSRPVDQMVWEAVSGKRPSGPLLEFVAEGELRTSLQPAAAAGEELIDLRVTADPGWLGGAAGDPGAAASLENGEAGAGAVSYALINGLLRVSSATDIGDLRPDGPDGGRVGEAVEFVEGVASILADSVDRVLGSDARIAVVEDLGFRVPLSVAPDGEHGVRAFLKGADFVTDGSGRYLLWAEARTLLACPAEHPDPAVGAEDRADRMRRRVTVTAGPQGASAGGPSDRRADLAEFAGRWLRGEFAGRMRGRYSDPLESPRRRVAGHCLVRTPRRIGHGFEVTALRNDLARNAVVVGIGGTGGP